jgi:hypothetical protein
LHSESLQSRVEELEKENEDMQLQSKAVYKNLLNLINSLFRKLLLLLLQQKNQKAKTEENQKLSQ